MARRAVAEEPTYPLFRECLECTLSESPCTELRDAASKYLPTPWQGEACSDTKVLFLSVNPSPSRAEKGHSGCAVADFKGGLSIRRKDYRRLNENDRENLCRRMYLSLATARGRRCRQKKKRRPFWSIAEKVATRLLDVDPIRPFRDFVLTEIIHCQTRKLAELGDSAAIASASRRCLSRHTLPLLDHMPKLRWIVAVSKSTERLLLSDGVLEEMVGPGNDARGLPSPTPLPAPNDKVKWLPAGNRLRVVFTPFLGCGQWRKSYYDALRGIPRQSVRE